MEMRGGCDQLIDVPNHIGGKEVQASNGEWILNYAPSTGNIISRIPKSNHQDVNNAVRVAKEAGEGWSLLSKNERADWLDRIADSLESRFDEIASLESLDTGKPIRISKAVDATRSVTNFRFYAQQIRELKNENFRRENATNHVIRHPVGVGALITPWN
ncbi:MAG: aldehyde dehydrogenase family protein, partial [Candidatus Thermoplasmatota archaeon]|nr:aldehyde dehydrogenase family protein [Candidatus Thermoplasmatota archaeon]